MKFSNRIIRSYTQYRIGDSDIRLLESNDRRLLVIITILFNFLLMSCESFVSIDPPRNEVVSQAVFSNDATAIAAMHGIYSEIMSNAQVSFANGGRYSVTILSGFSADEFEDYSDNNEYVQFVENSLTPENNRVGGPIWQEAYRYINNANAILEGLDQPNGVSKTIKDQLEGEAKFIRAFCHFYLVNLFGEIPVVTSTDYRLNATASRQSISEVYNQIIEDLKDAQNLLPNNYSHVNGERILPISWSATAMLARVYLYMESWIDAEEQATKVIDNSSMYFLETDLDDVFLSGSSEAIWQLMQANPSYTTYEAQFFIPTTTPPNYLSLTSEIINSFEIGDDRKNKWVGSITEGVDTWYFPYKYKVQASTNPLQEYSMVLRLAEQYLIRAEARTHQGGDLTDAIADVDAIRDRAGLPLIADTNPGINQKALLEAILQERKVELFAEWGHRWLDLKRTDRADDILELIKGGNWQSTDVLYPIPQSDIENNPNLTQNPGYN